MKYNWREESNQVKYYYRTTDGRVLGSVWQFVGNNTIWISKILSEEFPFTNNSEKFIGHFIDQESARTSVERFWLIQDNTLIEE